MCMNDDIEAVGLQEKTRFERKTKEGVARAYPGLILEGGKMKKKSGGQNPIFCPKIPNFFKNCLFLKKNLSARGGQLPPPPWVRP